MLADGEAEDVVGTGERKAVAEKEGEGAGGKNGRGRTWRCWARRRFSPGGGTPGIPLGRGPGHALGRGEAGTGEGRGRTGGELDVDEEGAGECERQSDELGVRGGDGHGVVVGGVEADEDEAGGVEAGCCEEVGCRGEEEEGGEEGEEEGVRHGNNTKHPGLVLVDIHAGRACPQPPI